MADKPDGGILNEDAQKVLAAAREEAEKLLAGARDEAATTLLNLRELPGVPIKRLGVTGLARSGKTIFITSLINNLMTRASLRNFGPISQSRLLDVKLVDLPPGSKGPPQFPYREHLEKLTADDPVWPELTTTVTEARLLVTYISNKWSLFRKKGQPSTIYIDIIDYPGEWLLDLPLLDTSYAKWSLDALDRIKNMSRNDDSEPFLEALAETYALSFYDEGQAKRLASTFTNYLRASRADGKAFSSLPPGRFLLPGELEGSDMLIFAPLRPPATEVTTGTQITTGSEPATPHSLYATFEQRYEDYKEKVVRPFFRDYFVRLDRQIVLVDMLQALNAGSDSVRDLRVAIQDVLKSFRQGKSNPIARLFYKTIDRILFAATKADHLHSDQHQAFTRLLQQLVHEATVGAETKGVAVKADALASVRATEEEHDAQFKGGKRPAVIGRPMKDEKLGDQIFDGKDEYMWFPGDPPASLDVITKSAGSMTTAFVRVMPPYVERDPVSGIPLLPHLNLGSALDFLIGDWLE